MSCTILNANDHRSFYFADLSSEMPLKEQKGPPTGPGGGNRYRQQVDQPIIILYILFKKLKRKKIQKHF